MDRNVTTANQAKDDAKTDADADAGKSVT